MIRAHTGGSRKVGDRASDLAHAVVAARAEAEPFDGGAQKDAPFRVRPAELCDGSAPQVGVGAGVQTPISRLLSGSGGADAPPDDRRRFAGLRVCDRLYRDSGDVGDEIDAVAERSGEAAAVLRDLDGCAAARPPLVAQKPTWARIHGGDEHEVGWKDRSAGRTGNRHAAVFQRLSQHFEYAPVELGHLVEEEHAVVRE